MISKTKAQRMIGLAKTRASLWRLPNSSRFLPLCFCIYLSVLVGCQSTPHRLLTDGKAPWNKLLPKPESTVEAPVPSQYIYAWNPPGMVVDGDFVNQNESGIRKVDLKKHAIGQEPETRTLKKVLANIYSLDRLNAISQETLYQTMVFRKRGPLTEVYPLVAVLRYRLGETVVFHRDMIGLIDGELLGLNWISEKQLAEQIGVDQINISVTGLVTDPGDVQILAEPIDNPEQPDSLQGLDVILETILGKDDSAIGQLLTTEAQGVLADWAIVTRIHDDEDSMLQGLQKIFVPNPLSEEYRLEQEPLDGEPSFADLGRLMILDGDAIEMAREF